MIKGRFVFLAAMLAPFYACAADAPAVQYAYELSASQKATLLDGVSRLKSGDTIEDVKKSLGASSVDEDVIGKNGAFLAHEMSYYVKRVSMDNANNNDQFVNLYFNNAGELEQIGYICVESVNGKVVNDYIVPETGCHIIDATPPMPDHS